MLVVLVGSNVEVYILVEDKTKVVITDVEIVIFCVSVGEVDNKVGVSGLIVVTDFELVEINFVDSGLKVVDNVDLIVEVGMSNGLSDIVGFDVVDEGFKVVYNVGITVEVGISVGISEIIGFDVVDEGFKVVYNVWLYPIVESIAVEKIDDFIIVIVVDSKVVGILGEM